MAPFQNPEAAERARERLEALTGADLSGFMESGFVDNPSPDLALTNLERWLRATSSPALHIDQMLALPSIGKLLVMLFGASQPIADSLIQNPELATLIFDVATVSRPLDPDRIRKEGLNLISAASSHVHALDRLRFLRQRWNLQIVINDLAGTWDQETVWRALSDLADVLIELTQEVVWLEFAKTKGLSQRPESLIVAFGKLGGSELNYSSDVDLVYVSGDGLEEQAERDSSRCFELLGRGLSDRMGRGSLYRVDLRLRPYGGAGPILRSMRAYEAYYQLYAEPWEIQALLRSRPITGSQELMARWEKLRVDNCFRPQMSEVSLEQLLAMKARIENGASENDLKRGGGGIRDVEFVTQILQMLHGYLKPELQVITTIDAIRALEEGGLLEHSVAADLVDGYRFLRKLEHRTQLVGDQQTHMIPAGDTARHGLAKLMGYREWEELRNALEAHRRTIQTLFMSTLSLESPTGGNRSVVQQRLGALAPAGLHWIDGLPESEAFFKGLVENEHSLYRVQKLLSDSPRLVSAFRRSLVLTELLMSGEILEISDSIERVGRLPESASPQQVAEVYAHAYATILCQWTLQPTFSLGERLSDLLDTLLRKCASMMGLAFDIVALGSYGARELSPGSDGDLLFLIADGRSQRNAEAQAEQFLAYVGHLKRLGASIEVDLRLRPDGKKGLLVRTFEGLRAYDLDGMEMWERFALGAGRLVAGSNESISVVLHTAFGLPLTPERLAELTKMKRRVETERVKPQHVHRDVKLGSGGLDDIEWLIHLCEMRYPTTLKQLTAATFKERVRRLAEGKILNAFEADILIDANRFLRDLRARIFLLGIDDDLLPENPDKLDRLARVCGYADGNLLLARHQSVVEPIRRLFLDCVDRLKI